MFAIQHKGKSMSNKPEHGKPAQTLDLSNTQIMAIIDIIFREQLKVGKAMEKNPNNVQKALYHKHLQDLRTYLNNYMQRSLDLKDTNHKDGVSPNS